MEVLTEAYLVEYRTKRATRGWKAVCPSCGGNDLWYTVNTSSAYCFECGSSYRVGDKPVNTTPTLYSPEEVAAVREAYEIAHTLYRERLSSSHRLYLADRGIDSSIIDQFYIGYCPTTILPMYSLEPAKLAGLCDSRGRPILGNRIVFPYPAYSKVTDMRGRAVQDVHPRYISPRIEAIARGATFPFNYDRALQRLKQTGTLIITEGEIKAILADAHGYAAVALPGMMTWRTGVLDLLSSRVVVVFDNSVDPWDRIRVDKAIARIANRIPEFYVGVLPLLGEDKQDIDSFLLHPKGGYSRFDYIINNAIPFATYRQLRRF
jgi:DNA primase